MSTQDLADQLRAVLGGGTVDGLRRLTGGASRETWSFNWTDPDGAHHPLILQRQRAGSDRDMSVEIAALRAARSVEVPVAEVVAASATDEALGAPFMVVRRVEGETIARRILRDETFARARPLLTAQLGEALAKLHTVDPDAVPGLTEIDQVTHYREVLDALGQPHPSFELGLRWLEQHRPDPGRRSVVHGDFRLGNIIVGSDGLRAVLDWELTHVGDPLEDLGWLCVKAWRFGSAQPVAGVGEYDELFDAYEATSGVALDFDAVRWWEVLGTLKWGVMCILQANAHLSGMARSHELAAIGRRVCENEHDLFLALERVW